MLQAASSRVQTKYGLSDEYAALGMHVERSKRFLVSKVMMVEVSDIAKAARPKKIEQASTHGKREPAVLEFYRTC